MNLLTTEMIIDKKRKKYEREGGEEEVRGETETERFIIVETHVLSLTETRHDQIGHPCTHRKCLLIISLPCSPTSTTSERNVPYHLCVLFCFIYYVHTT